MEREDPTISEIPPRPDLPKSSDPALDHAVAGSDGHASSRTAQATQSLAPYKVAADWSSKAAPSSAVLTEERPAVAPEAKSLTAADVEPVIQEGRPCPTCNVRNPDAALFCWQCYRAFTQVQMRPHIAMPMEGLVNRSPPVGSPLQPALDSSSNDAVRMSAPRSKWVLVTVGVIVAIVAAGIGKGVWENLNRTHLQVPQSIGGMQRIDDPSLADTVRNLESIAAEHGTAGKAAFYGYDGLPNFFFAAVEYRSGDGSPDDLFTEFAGGFASGGSQTAIDLRSKTTNTHAGATYICAKLRGKPSGTICMWVDQDIVGFVGAYRQGIDIAQTLTAVVRTSVET
jgi:hypothetical protein